MTISLDQVQRLADQLSPPEQVQLIEHLTQRIALALATLDTPAQLREKLAALPTARVVDEQLPVLTGGTWIEDLPQSRRDLYDADERC